MTGEVRFKKIQINKDLWLHFGRTSISWGGNFLPDKVHYTISFPEDKDLVNFHITNEINLSDKPRLKIITLSKENFKSNEDGLRVALANSILTPLKSELIEQYLECAFFPISTIENSPLGEVMNKELVLSASEISFVKKKKVKVKGDVSKQLDKVLSAIDHEEVKDHIVSFGAFGEVQEVITGYILKESPIYLMGSRNGWYIMDVEKLTNPYKLLSSIINPETIINIKWLLNRSLVQIQSLHSFEESQQLENPIHLHAGIQDE